MRRHCHAERAFVVALSPLEKRRKKCHRFFGHAKQFLQTRSRMRRANASQSTCGFRVAENAGTGRTVPVSLRCNSGIAGKPEKFPLSRKARRETSAVAAESALSIYRCP